MVSSGKLGKTFIRQEDVCKVWQSGEEASVRGMLADSCGWGSGFKRAGSCWILKTLPSPMKTARAEIEQMACQLSMDTRTVSKDCKRVIAERLNPSHEPLTPTSPILDPSGMRLLGQVICLLSSVFRGGGHLPFIFHVHSPSCFKGHYDLCFFFLSWYFDYLFNLVVMGKVEIHC